MFMKQQLNKPTNQPTCLFSDLCNVIKTLTFCCCFLLIFIFSVHASKNNASLPIADTLEQKLKKFDTDTAKILYLNRLAWKIRKQNYDQSMEIAALAGQLS